MSQDSAVSQVISVGIPVADTERALAFYTGELGMEKRRDMPFGDGRRWVEVAPPGATTTLALVPPGMPVGIRLGVADAEAARAGLSAAGADTDAELTLLGPGVPPMFTMRDPDGNGLIVIGGVS